MVMCEKQVGKWVDVRERTMEVWRLKRESEIHKRKWMMERREWSGTVKRIQVMTEQWMMVAEKKEEVWGDEEEQGRMQAKLERVGVVGPQSVQAEVMKRMNGWPHFEGVGGHPAEAMESDLLRERQPG
jgi:hypothetical protein